MGWHSYPRRRYLRRPPKWTPCGYCFQNWATGYDHLMPLVAGGTNQEENLYPCCRRCNSLASCLIFKTIEAKRDYVQRELRERGEWKKTNLPPVRELPEEV